MPGDNQIRYIKADSIEKDKWDRCISAATNGLVYARSAYLDTMAPGWDALVLNDYEIVMPIPWRKKWSKRYIFQPSMTPILGIFGNEIGGEIVDRFLHAIPKDYVLWDLSLNPANQVEITALPAYRRTNCILPLSADYNTLQSNYQENTRRNIRKAISMNCSVRKGIPLADIIAICREEFPKFTHVEPGLFEQLEHVYENTGLETASYGVYNDQGVLLASAAFIFFKKRIYYWLVGNGPDSKQYNASYLLIDAVIRDYAGTGLILDFEGSDKKSIADFYLKFGATSEYFTSIFYNRLPFPFSLLKQAPAQYGDRIS